jgi:hypothetical protein
MHFDKIEDYDFDHGLSFNTQTGEYYSLNPHDLARPLSHEEMDYNLMYQKQTLNGWRIAGSNADLTLNATDLGKVLAFHKVEVNTFDDPGNVMYDRHIAAGLFDGQLVWIPMQFGAFATTTIDPCAGFAVSGVSWTNSLAYQEPAPTFLVIPNNETTAEGNVVTFAINTTNLDDGTTIGWTLGAPTSESPLPTAMTNATAAPIQSFSARLYIVPDNNRTVATTTIDEREVLPTVGIGDQGNNMSLPTTTRSEKELEENLPTVGIGDQGNNMSLPTTTRNDDVSITGDSGIGEEDTNRDKFTALDVVGGQVSGQVTIFDNLGTVTVGILLDTVAEQSELMEFKLAAIDSNGNATGGAKATVNIINIVNLPTTIATTNPCIDDIAYTIEECIDDIVASITECEDDIASAIYEFGNPAGNSNTNVTAATTLTTDESGFGSGVSGSGSGIGSGIGGGGNIPVEPTTTIRATLGTWPTAGGGGFFDNGGGNSGGGLNM